MIYKLITEDSKTILTLEIGLEQLRKEPNLEIRSTINLKTYSDFLMEIINVTEMEAFIECFDEISTLREWMWDEFFANKPNVAVYFDEVVKHVKNILLGAANDYNLKLV